MRTREFDAAGIHVPVVGQGTWDMERDPPSAVRALRRGLDLGTSHIDTAEMYGSGAVETIVGEAIAGRRNEVFLASKVLPENAAYTGALQACERSLKRLRTDHLDLYLLHWRGSHPLEETFRAFEKLRADGKITNWGVSNFDVADLDEGMALVGPGRIACNQVLYHLRQRAIEYAVIPWCERHGVAVVAYSPFGSGRFPADGSTGGRVLREIADAHGATARQVALAFLVRRPSVFAIPKAARVEHVEENAEADDLKLTHEELARIERAFPARRRRELPTL